MQPSDLPRPLVLAALGLTACATTQPLPRGAAAELQRAAAASTGELVYIGTVGPRRDEDRPLYRYERRVRDLDQGVRSSHLTRTLDGDPVLLHQADHTATYELIAFREVHAQTGLVGSVDVGPDGTATLRATVDGRTRVRVEPPGDPLHVGPTLFGHVLEHWDALATGAPHVIRFAVLEEGRSYRFVLRRVPGAAGTTTFEMVPRSLLLRLAVPGAELVFDRDRDIVRYSGLVPPLEEVGADLERLDATVTYTHMSGRYR